MSNNLRQSPEKKQSRPKRVQETHHLGQMGGLWCCQECMSMYTHARNHHDAQLSHAAHCALVAEIRANPERESNLADEHGDMPPLSYPHGQGIWRQ